jgi:hypothetical protein
MARILLRSPYFVTVTTASHLSAKMQLTIDGTLRYTILKNATSNRTVFEISSLTRDYIDLNFTGVIAVADTVDISYVITTYTGLDGTGTNQGSQPAVTHTGFDGYSEFKDGVNTALTTSQDPTYVGDCGGDGIIYLPDNTAGRLVGWTDDATPVLSVFSIGAAATSVDTPARTYNITRVCNPKYTNVKLIYLNKYGQFQEFYFFLKNIETFNTKEEKFKRNIFTYSTSSYNNKDHQTKVFNKNGRTKLTLNTDYIDECYNEVIQDIMLSEYVWVYYDVWRPCSIVTSSLTHKTSVNDKLIQYTLEVEFANDHINNIV